jgi:hypothetical protein
VAAELTTQLPPSQEQPTAQPQPSAEDIELGGVLLPAAQKAVEENPDSPRAHLAFGVALVDDGQVPKGYEEIRKASELGAKTPAFLIGAARSLDKIGLPLGAAMMYLRLSENARLNAAGPGIGPLVNNLHSSVYYGFADPIAPEVLPYSTLNRVDEPLSLIAQIHYSIVNRPDDPALAQKLIDELRQMQPGMAEADLLQAELFSSHKNPEEAKKILDKVLATPNTPEWIIQRAKEMLAQLP